MVLDCLPSDALSQHLPSHLGFSYLGHEVSLHGCSSKVHLLLLTLDVGYLLMGAPPDLGCGVATLSCSCTVQLLWEIKIKWKKWKKEYKKAKWLSEEASQRAVKGKEEKEIYTHLNAEFQRRARRDEEIFLSVQCKKIEENNRMGKTRDLFKKIRDTKGTFHAKMGT